MNRYIKENGRSSLIYLCLLCYSIYILLPMASPAIPQPLRYVILLLFVVLSGLFTIRETFFDKSAFFILLLVVLYTLLFYYSKNGTIGDDFVSFFMSSFLFWIPMLICSSINELSGKERINLTTICIIVIILSTITTIVGNLHYPLVSRYMAGKWSSEIVSNYQKKNIGGYEFVYALTILMPYWAYARNRKGFYIVSRIMIIGTIFVAFITQYTLAWVICLLELFVFILTNRKRKILKVFLALFILYIICNKEQIGSFLYKAQAYFGDQGMITISERIGSIGDFFAGRKVEGDFIDRQALYLYSLEAFYRNPVIGSLGDYTKLGGHSTIFDTLGGLGILGITLFFTSIGYYIYKIRTLFQTTLCKYIIMSFVAFFIICIFNTGINGCSGFVLFLTPVMAQNSTESMSDQIEDNREKQMDSRSYFRNRGLLQ